MARNICGFNSIKNNVRLNFVAAYITWTERYYNNDYQPRSPSELEKEDFVGFIHVIEGEGQLIFPDKKINIKKNDFMFIRYRDLTAIITKNSEMHFYCVWFHLDNLHLEFNKLFSLPPLENERETVEEIARLLNNNEYYSVGQANGLGIKLLCQLLSRLDSKTADDPYREIIRNAVFYINQNAQNIISVKELADMSNVSEKHFRNLFTAYMGMPPKQYYLKVKLERAASLLTFSAQSITEISDELSFLSPAYFIKRFKLYHGVTPSEYRKRGKLKTDSEE